MIEHSLKHIAIIMDGNRRWAEIRGLSSNEGHEAGVDAVEEAIRNVCKFNIPYLTLYAFSTENWKRSDYEVSYLFNLFKHQMERILAKEEDDALYDDVAIRFIGNREYLDSDIVELMERIEAEQQRNIKCTVQLAINYGGQDEIVRAIRKLSYDDIKNLNIDSFAEKLDSSGVPDPDLIVRTSGEMRLSNFMSWQSAYSEILFTERYWPDFDEGDMRFCIQEFEARQRRKGA